MRPDAARRTAGKSTMLRRLAQPWTLILIITGLFQVFRGAPVDGAFFLGVAALLLADAVGWLPRVGPRRPRAAWLLVAAVPLAVALLLAPRHGVVEGVIVSAIGVSVLLLAWGEPGAAGSSADPITRTVVDTSTGAAAGAGTDATTGATKNHTAPSPKSHAAHVPAVRSSASPDPVALRPMSPTVRRAAILWSIVGVVCCLWEVASFLLGLPSPEAAIAHPSISELFDPILDSAGGRAVFTVLWLLLGVALVRRGVWSAHGGAEPGVAPRVARRAKRKKARR